MNKMNNVTDWTTCDRRSFMMCSLAAGFGLRNVAAVDAMESALREPQDMVDSLDPACHPFAPERVVVMTNSAIDGWQYRDRRVDAAIRSSLREQFQLSTGKHDVIFGMMRVMTDYYRVPHLFGNWATRLVKREALASTGYRSRFACFYEFQDHGVLQPVTPPVDWWLFLFPDGIDWDSLDGEPVFGMIGHVFRPHYGRLPSMKWRAYDLAEWTGRSIGLQTENWTHVAHMDRTSAAQAVNQVIVSVGRSELEELQTFVNA